MHVFKTIFIFLTGDNRNIIGKMNVYSFVSGWNRFEVYQRFFAAAYNNKAYAPSSNQTSLRSHFKCDRLDALEPTKQDGVVYNIPCKCGKVYIGETGRAMQERKKEHDRDIRLARTQTSAVSERPNETGHFPIWKEVKFIDRDPHWYIRRVKEAIHVRLHPNNINRDSGIDIYDQKAQQPINHKADL